MEDFWPSLRPTLCKRADRRKVQRRTNATASSLYAETLEEPRHHSVCLDDGDSICRTGICLLSDYA